MRQWHMTRLTPIALLALLCIPAGAAAAATSPPRPPVPPTASPTGLPARSALDAPAPADTLEQRLAPCLACHARPDRDDAFYPRLAGKPERYLLNQLRNFRDGRRQFPMMTWMVQNLPDAYLGEIAAYFAAAPHPPVPVPPVEAAPAQRERGAHLVRHGDAAVRVPACVACHGSALTGIAPAIPGLLGLPRDYINAQLGAWRDGRRHAGAPDCMADVAQRLPLQDIAAISAYLASTPVPAGAQPAAALPRPMPLRCGSQP
jgi:cytochrome c553